MISKSRLSSAVLVATVLVPMMANAGITAVGLISFDVLVPAATQQPGVNVVNLGNFTGGFSLLPDFPVTSDLSFQNLILTIQTSTTTQDVSLPDLPPGPLIPPATLQLSSDIEIEMITLVAILSSSVFDVAGLGTVTAVGPNLLFVLSPSSGSFLQPDVDFGLLTVELQDVSAIPEPHTAVLALIGLAILTRLRRRHS